MTSYSLPAGSMSTLLFTPHTELSLLRLPFRPPLRRRYPITAGIARFGSGGVSVRCVFVDTFGGGGAIVRDVMATGVVLVGSFGLVSAFDCLTQRRIIEQKAGSYHVRIAIHGFLAAFQNSTSIEARYFASLVPFANCLRLLINGLSLSTDERFIKSVSREGNPGELLRGPLYYVLVLIFCALLFWRESPIGVISLAMMCGGDGIADIVGRRFGAVKIPYNQRKSWAGSISMFAFGILVAMGMLYYFSMFGYFELDWLQTLEKVALVSLVATLVESLSTAEVIDDNISVPLVSMITAYTTFYLAF
ncbi:putative phytol kinase 1, chloroplastic [Drosera capensis]